MASYQYQPFPIVQGSDDIYIRLLCLPPGPRSGPIVCSIVTTLLSEAPKFAAVSYCWGLASDHTDIYVTDGAKPAESGSGKVLQVPTSIISFLYRTRSQDGAETCLLWIDSICINQRDPGERSRQIPKMRDIYAKAKTTMSWLGPETDNSNDAFAYALELATLLRQHLARNGEITIPEKEMSQKIDPQVKPGDPRLEALVAIHERPYFQRAWIVQEVAVSKYVVLVCGDAIITMDQFLCAFCYLVMVTPSLWEFYPRHLQVFVWRLKWATDDWKNAATTDWLKVLLKYRVYESTDPRDKIYAYYGLRCQDQFRKLGIEPDYKNIDTRTLFTTLAANALLAGHVDLLHVPRLVIPEATKNSIPSIPLPSWAPDWRCTKQTPSPILHLTEDGTSKRGIRDFKASCETEPDITFDVSPPGAQKRYTHDGSYLLPTMIRLRGFAIATVTYTTPPWTMESHTGQSTLLRQAQGLLAYRCKVEEWVKVMDISLQTPHYKPTKQAWTEAFCETITANTTEGTLEQRRTLGAAMLRRQRIFGPVAHFYRPVALVIFSLVIIFQRILRTLFGHVVAETRYRWLAGIIFNRRAARCTTSSTAGIEYMAIVPGLAAPGDRIVLVKGLSMPLVMRNKGTANVTAEGREQVVQTWEMLGDCYVHGVMEGQVWERRNIECEDLWIA
ncbi:hypothetical protein ACEQ8H_008485 [Pleosporales sp. CAS-2024a]